MNVRVHTEQGGAAVQTYFQVWLTEVKSPVFYCSYEICPLTLYRLEICSGNK